MLSRLASGHAASQHPRNFEASAEVYQARAEFSRSRYY